MNFLDPMAFDQVAWQQAFYHSLNLQASEADENRILLCDHSDTANVPLDFPVWTLDRFDLSFFQTSLTSHHFNTVIAVAKKIFEERLPELKSAQDLFIGFTGSDGREEKLSPLSSPVEILVSFRGKGTVSSDVLERVRILISEHPNLFYSAIEVKCLQTDALMMFKGAKDERPFPTRALDVQYLTGDVDFFVEYRKAFFRELQEPQNNKLLRAFKKSAVQPACQVLKHVYSGVDKSQIDLSQGKVFHDGKRIKAVKYPYLRPIQYKLAMHIFCLIQSKKLSETDFLHMPFTTVDRIQWLVDKKLILATPAEVKTFQKAYVVSLIWFAISQKRFEVLGIAETSFPSRDLKEGAEAIQKFCDALALSE